MQPASNAPESMLPILARRREIEDALRSHPVIVVCGETGSGKTTQLPRIALESMGAWVGSSARAGERGTATGGLIGHTQPRRLAARSVAARIAQEMGQRLGEADVGVKVRFNDQTSARTRIKVMTDGILLAELATDPELRAYGAIIIDEAHERSLNIDFLLGYLRELVPRRLDLRVIVTSATIEPKRLSDYFAAGIGDKVPIIEVSGRTFPIQVRYRGEASNDDAAAGVGELDYDAIADAAEELISPRTGAPGDILVFLPGEREIRLARDAIARRRLDVTTLPLFSRLTDQEQDVIFDPSAASGRRRIILATNIAETSLTVPGIRHVIDTGVARLSRYDAAKKVQRLPVEAVSRASADQRSGRCGRLGPGVCIRLYSETSYRSRPAFTEPEIRRTSLASVILHMKSLGTRLRPIERFEFLDAPDAGAIQDGYETLFELGAIEAGTGTGMGASAAAKIDWSRAEVTPIGCRLARLPVDPRIGRMLVAAQSEGTLEETLVLAGVLSIQDPRERPMGKQEDADRAHAVFRHPDSDFLVLLNIWDQYAHEAASGRGGLGAWCRDRFVSPARMREWTETVRQLRSMTRDLQHLPGADDDAEIETDEDEDVISGPDSIGKLKSPSQRREDAIHRTLLTGLISNVACREGASGSFEYRGVRGNVVHLFPGSVLFKRGPKWIMAAEVVQTTRLFARTAGRIEPEWIEELAGHMFRVVRTDPHLDVATGHVCAWERVTMSTIVVVPRREVRIGAIQPDVAREVFVRDALGKARWELDSAFMHHNREVLRGVERVEAKLRRHGALVGDDVIAAWFEARVPAGINTPEAFEAWRARAEREPPGLLMISLADVVNDAFRAALDPIAYPDTITVDAGGEAVECAVDYSLSPGKDADGITFTLPLMAIPDVSEDTLAWLVPGWLPALVQAMLKTLAKPVRAAVEHVAPLSEVAEACAVAMAFRRGSIEHSLSEAVQVLFEVEVPPTGFQRRALPTYLHPRVRVVDAQGVSMGVDRDLSALQQRFAARAQKERASREPGLVEQHGLTDWTFGALQGATPEAGGETAELHAAGFPALIDAGESVSLVRLASFDEAAARTILGVRRLFALRCREEVSFSIEAMPRWHEMCSQYGQLGTSSELRDALTVLVAGRAYLDGQSLPRTKDEFEDRAAAGSARLHMLAREVSEVLGTMLEHRHKVAHRLSGGTSRLWAESVADMREQAAYLMPRRFLFLVSWERLRRYPVYAQSMRERLFSLRDEGIKVSTELLRIFHPHWKRFTGYVAARMSQERAAQLERESQASESAPGTGASASRAKTPLPQSRRAAPTVNVDAGEWAMQPGRLGGAIDAYRWALEELRVGLFTPGLTGSNAVVPPTSKQVEAMWEMAIAARADQAKSKPKPGRR